MSAQHTFSDPAVKRAIEKAEAEGLPSDAYGAGYQIFQTRSAIFDLLSCIGLEAGQDEIADAILSWRKHR
jgi:hypothetical protein